MEINLTIDIIKQRLNSRRKTHFVIKAFSQNYQEYSRKYVYEIMTVEVEKANQPR